MMESPARVAILLATRNGKLYLPEQLRSLGDQTCGEAIDIWASDDGSTDGTWDLLHDWQARWTRGRIEVARGPRKGFAENFRALLRNDADAAYYAFCDQDDIWEPRKLERAIAWMRSNDPQGPLLFCSRTLTMSQDGDPLGHSPLFAREPSFRNALVQSIAGGNTMVMNRAARDLVSAASAETSFVSHDWWSYLLVTGAGGKVFYSTEPLVRYRQHEGNQVGANVSWSARLSRLRRLFEGQFKRWTETNMAGLDANRILLTADALEARDLFLRSRQGFLFSRLRNLRASGVYRQTLMGQVGLYIAICIGRI